MNDIERVSQFWDSARARVLEIAEAAKPVDSMVDPPPL